jgi:hypothetical protein
MISVPLELVMGKGMPSTFGFCIDVYPKYPDSFALELRF